MSVGVFFGWLIFSLVVGFIGSSRKIGFGLSFFLSLILSPLIGLIITLVSKNKEEEKYKQEVLKTQEAQKVALEKLSSKNSKSETKLSIADELLKLKNLKDDNVINEKEFIELKKHLMNGKKSNSKLDTIQVSTENNCVPDYVTTKYTKPFDFLNKPGEVISIKFDDDIFGKIIIDKSNHEAYFESNSTLFHYKNFELAKNALYFSFKKNGEIEQEGLISKIDA